MVRRKIPIKKLPLKAEFPVSGDASIGPFFRAAQERAAHVGQLHFHVPRRISLRGRSNPGGNNFLPSKFA